MAIVKVVTAGPCALIWLVGLRVFEQTTLFFSHKQTLLLLEGGLGTATAPLPITCIRAIAALAVKGGRDSDCLPPRRSSTPVGCLGRLGGKRGKQLRLPNERRVSHNSARICRRVAPLAGQSLGATRSCHGTQEAGPGPSSFAGESRSVDVDVASECALQSPQERDGCPGQSSHRAILPSRPLKITRQRMPQIHSNGQPSRQ